MPRFSRVTISELFGSSDQAPTVHEKGRVLEQLACYLFECVPGIELPHRNERNPFNAEEIDVAVWNNQHRNGLPFLPYQILIECKNWSRPVGNQEVSFFVTRLGHRGLTLGILIAANGITGNAVELTDSHFQIANALQRGIRLIVITRQEIEDLRSVSDLVTLIKSKLLLLAVSGTSIR